MKVEVNYDRCEGHGVCVRLAPSIFEMGDDDEQVRIINHMPDKPQQANVILASQRCPRLAITVTQ